MNTASVILLLALALFSGLALRACLRDKKKASRGCSGCCSGCSGCGCTGEK